jgi:hypothetical protein
VSIVPNQSKMLGIPVSVPPGVPQKIFADFSLTEELLRLGIFSVAILLRLCVLKSRHVTLAADSSTARWRLR